MLLESAGISVGKTLDRLRERERECERGWNKIEEKKREEGPENRDGKIEERENTFVAS